jgi:hypothetical protein
MRVRASSLILAAIVCLLSTGCGMKMMVKGRVVDAVTGEPVEGAAVAIKWVHEKWGPPGLPTPKDRLGTTETLTDAQGDFTIPCYIWRTHNMGVYKKGYICWSSETKFNPLGKTYEEMYQTRYWHSVSNGMTIQLEPMPNGLTVESREKHAHFTVDVQTLLSTSGFGYFDEAIRNEKEFHREILRRNSKEK